MFFLSVLLSSAPSAFAGEKPWTEVRSPNFRVLTNGSPQNATKVAREFEQLRWVFATRFPGARLDSGAPLLILAVRDEDTAKSLEPQLRGARGDTTAGLFHHGWEKQFAMVRLDTFGGNGAKEVVCHEYAHTVLHLNLRWLPTWLDEGMAEFYAYTRFEEHKTYLGAPTVRTRVLHNYIPSPIEDLMGVTRDSSFYNEEFFYAESWAWVHFLMYGPGMEGGRKLDQFIASLQEGVDQRKAFRQIFGEPKEVDKAFVTYTWVGAVIGTQSFAASLLRSAPQIEEKEFAVRTTSLAETEAELASYHLWIHDLVAARGLAEEALKADPKLGLAHEDMGFLDFADGKDGEAANEFAQACELDNRLYLSQFAKTMLSPLPRSTAVTEMNAFGASMGKVLQINPLFAPAYVQLARLAVREDDLSSALVMSRKAEELEPSLAGYHLLSGNILERMGKGGDAAGAAKFVADRWFGSDHNEAVELWNSVPAAQRSQGEAIVEIGPKDTQRVEGELKSVVCADKEQDWALVLALRGQSMTFRRKGGFDVGFSDTIWYGGDHFNLCHHLDGMHIIVWYRPPTEPSYAGDVSEIEVRDELPQSLKREELSLKP